MAKKYAKPLVICFEGIDGCGKTTLIENLKNHLDAEGIPSVIRAYVAPGYLREAVLHDETLTPIMRATLLRFIAANVAKEVDDLLCQGFFVLMDRGPMTYQVYQGVIAGLKDELPKIEKLVGAPLVPDYTFLLDIDPEISDQRLVSRGIKKDHIESTMVATNAAWIRQAYLDEQAKDMDHRFIIDADQNPKLLLSEVVDQFEQILLNELAEELSQ